MKTPRIINAVGNIDDDLVSGATRAKAVKKNSWLKWGAMAACFTVIFMAVIVAPMMFEKDDPIPPVDNDTVFSGETETVEAVYEQKYLYSVDEGDFSTYVGGKVISEDKIDKKISDVSVTAGWKDNTGKWLTTEKLKAEIYEIEGVEHCVAVALKFIDQGDAITTTHYYVIMNPQADLTPVEEYIIASILPNDPHDEMVLE